MEDIFWAAGKDPTGERELGERKAGREREGESEGEREPKQTKQQKIGVGYEISPQRETETETETDGETERGVCGEGARRGCMAHALHAFAKQ